jgi:hypothetical protein
VNLVQPPDQEARTRPQRLLGRVDLRQRARAAAGFLGLEYEERRTGYGELQPSLVQFVNVGTHA